MGLLEKYVSKSADYIHEDLSKVFKNLRKSRGFTQSEVADICGVSRITVVAWEKGSAKIPAYAIFMMLANAKKYADVEL